MKRIHWIFGYLKPVARVIDCVRHHVMISNAHSVEMQERWLLLWWTQISKYQSIMLYYGISTMTDTFGNCAALRLTWYFEYSAVNVKQPAVVATT